MRDPQEHLSRFQAGIGVEFHDPLLLDEALTHSSYVHEYPDSGAQDNQRLEFLGDAILDFVVGEWLFRINPEMREGALTALRARIVRTEGLASLAKGIQLGQYLRLGRGEDKSGGRSKPANLCAAFEALVGALYLDQGIVFTRQWIVSMLSARAGEIEAQRPAKDAKTRLQEYTQAIEHITPQYRITSVDGPAHARVFSAEVLLGDSVWGQGTGASKHAAQQAAASVALAALLAA